MDREDGLNLHAVKRKFINHFKIFFLSIHLILRILSFSRNLSAILNTFFSVVPTQFNKKKKKNRNQKFRFVQVDHETKLSFCFFSFMNTLHKLPLIRSGLRWRVDIRLRCKLSNISLSDFILNFLSQTIVCHFE